ERARVCLANLLLNPSNVLILDEPTNHLDLKAKDVLKEAISKYPGTVIVVSHDRDFLVGLTNKVFEFNDGIVKEFVGDVNDFFEERRLASFREVELNPIPKAEPKKIEVVKVDDKEAKRIKNQISKIEESIALKELDIKNIETQIELLSDKNQYDENLIKSLSNAQKELEKLMSDWESLQS
ncbi:MAG TPA: hypothetical protein PLW92_10780, partial [Chitinophagales bacterium]|nr:hypothetical protein [Chitinophagales bacterium]